ncbi:hypothetical protein IWW37_005218 [Coemansia sp. RSA 2050]|nr:hypothetical protein IWW37_005218 [Coemansia sp. RSA 2050]
MGLFSSCFGEVDTVEHSRRARRHTGHLGIGTVQGSDFTMASDPEKLKTLMSQVSAALDDTDLFGDAEGTASPSSSPSAKSSSLAMGVAF